MALATDYFLAYGFVNYILFTSVTTMLFYTGWFYAPAHFFTTHIIALAPKNKAKYSIQQENVHIPLPQHKPVKDNINIGTKKASIKFLICILHPKRIKQGRLKKLGHLYSQKSVRVLYILKNVWILGSSKYAVDAYPV